MSNLTVAVSSENVSRYNIRTRLDERHRRNIRETVEHNLLMHGDYDNPRPDENPENSATAMYSPTFDE